MDSRKALLIVERLRYFLLGLLMDTLVLLSVMKRKQRRLNSEGDHSYSLKEKIPERIQYLVRLTKTSEQKCIKQLRMGRDAFGRLCIILHQAGGLADSRHVSAAEQVCLFLSVLSHHKKNCTVYIFFELPVEGRCDMVSLAVEGAPW